MKPNSWSCLPTAFATVLNCLPELLIKKCGHDGSEIVFPGLPEPQCRRAFHIQEMIGICLDWGYLVTPIIPYPAQTPDGGEHIYRFDNEANYRAQLVGNVGVITGSYADGSGHALAWDGTGYAQSLSQVFTPNCFWRIDCVQKR